MGSPKWGQVLGVLQGPEAMKDCWYEDHGRRTTRRGRRWLGLSWRQCRHW